jgi:glycosyltransferase involved in cell wall biosynthesis
MNPTSLRILILTQYFSPDGASWIPDAVAAEMKKRGHQVKVLTAFPHYTSGRVAEGYRQRLRFTEVRDGIEVRRVPVVPSHSRNPIGRIANYISFIITSRTAKRYVEDSDVIYVYGTPATVVEPARAWSKSLGIPYVYHVQDIWPESVTESGFLPRRVLDAMVSGINRWLKRVYKSASATIVIAPTARQMLIDRGVPPERAHLVYNWSDGPEEIDRSPSKGLALLYAGNFGDFQDLETVIRAARKLDHLPGFQLRIAGGGVLEHSLKSLVKELNAGDSIQFVGRVAKEQMPSLYAEADFQIVSLKNLDIFAGTIPSKFQAGLAHGLPVITTVKGDVTRLVNEHGLGFSALPEDVDSLAAAFLEAYLTSAEERQEFSKRARAFYESHFSKAYAIDRIESILQTAAESKAVAK